MPARDPTKTQLDNPELVRDLISQLEIIGQIGLLDFVPAVNPVFIVGSRNLNINTDPPVYQSAQIFDQAAFGAVAGTVLADTGQLPAGDYDIWANLSGSGISTPGNSGHLVIEHRNAANAATLATLLQIGLPTTVGTMFGHLPLTGYRIALDERIRAIMLGAGMSGVSTCSFGVRVRPSP